MGLAGLSPMKLLIVLALILLLFDGRGRLSGLMSDMAAGLRNFRKGLREPVDEGSAPPARAQPQVLLSTNSDAAEVRPSRDA